MVFENEYIYTILHVVYVVYIFFIDTDINSSAYCNHCMFLKTKKNKGIYIHIRIYALRTRKSMLLLVQIFLSSFYLRFFFNNSGRDITCFPNALFISGRDLIQSFESRHGRHGNSNSNYIRIREITIVDEIIQKKQKQNKQLCIYFIRHYITTQII